MGANFLDHAAAEAAIRECRVYAAYLSDLREALHRNARQMEQYWQGKSYDHFYDALTNLGRQIDQAHAASTDAVNKLHAGLERARAAEREADRQEELRKQAASANRNRTP